MRIEVAVVALAGSLGMVAACEAPPQASQAATMPGRVEHARAPASDEGPTLGAAPESSSTSQGSESVKDVLREHAALPSWPLAADEPRDGECVSPLQLCTVLSMACCCLVCTPEVHVGCFCWGGGGGACFPGEATVSMADGTTRSIAGVEAGDRVLSLDPATEQVTVANVLAVERHEQPGYPLVSIDGLQIGADHPVIVGDRLVPAALVAKGDRVRKLDGDGVQVVGRKVKHVAAQAVLEPSVPSSSVTYTLEVDGSRSYFVGGIAVHNKVK